MSMVAIITARGGSKRIHKKNIKEFCGKPIIAYSIEAAINSGIFDEVMVSTDSEEIASIAKIYGAKIPFIRSTETSDDYATTADVIEEVLSNYKQQGKEYESFCCIYPTAPFVTSRKLMEAKKLLNDNVEAVMPVVRYSFPPQRAMVIKEGILMYQYPEYRNARSQDLEPIYHDCGQFYMCKSASFLENKTLVPERTLPMIVAEEEVQDIDTLSDWRIAEIKYINMNSKDING